MNDYNKGYAHGVIVMSVIAIVIVIIGEVFK